MVLNFSNIEDGIIGLVLYYIEETIPMSDEQQQYIVDQDTKAALYALSQSATLNPNQGYIDIQAEITKARMQGTKRAEDLRKQLVQKATHHQVGQKESIDELLTIEKKPNFRGWVDPESTSGLINYTEQNEST